jgi:hypothetical protein
MKVSEYIIFIICILYLLFGYELPLTLARMIDTRIGNTLVWSLAVLIMLLCNPFLGIVAIFVAYDLVVQSSIQTGGYLSPKYSPNEKKKYEYLNEYNQFPYTLEQEVISKMAPIQRSGSFIKKYAANFTSFFKPLLELSHDAAPIGHSSTIF